jgi:hypothetical protein
MSTYPDDPQPSTPAARPFPPVSGEGPGAPGAPPDRAPTSLLQTGPPPGEPAPRRSSRLRWVAALVATAIVVVAGVAVAMLAGGSRTPPALGPTFLPAGSAAYLEARLDLPGDQRERIAQFIGHFPGFADPSTFERKVDDVFDDLLGRSTGNLVTWTRDIKPWFGGQIALGLPSMPDPSAPSDSRAPFVVAFSVSDRSALEGWLDQVGSFAPGLALSEEAYGGSTIVTATMGDGPSDAFAWVVTDDLWIVGQRDEDIRAAIDIRAGRAPGLATSEPFASSFGKLPVDRLGAFYLDVGSLGALLEPMTVEQPGLGAALDQLPRSIVGSLRAESDRVTLESRIIPGPETPALTARSTTLAARMPAETSFYLETRDVGRTIHTFIQQVLASDAVPVPEEQLEQAEDFLGAPVEEFFDWIADVAIAVDVEDQQGQLGIVATVTDETLAVRRMERLATAARAALVLAGEAPVELVEEEHAGTTITTIRATSDLELPADLPIEASVSFAISGGQFLLGTGTFVTDALDRQQADSLAADPRFADALTAAGGAENTGVVFVDLGRIRTAAEAYLSPEQRATYDRDISPYVTPLDRLVSVVVLDGQELVSRTLIFVK